MAQIPEELWLRIFGGAKTVMAKPNLIELGPPPGSNATAGFINAPTPAEADEHPEPPMRRYPCGLAFGPEATQEEVYESVGTPLLEAALDGYNTTILSYGPRGAGKAYTVEGGEVGERGQHGLLQRGIRHAFLESNRRGEVGLKIRLSCFVVYRNSTFDMLAPDAPAARELKRQDASGERVQAFVDNLHAPAAKSVEDALQLIQSAQAARRRLPMCDKCANWTRELDTFWCIYLTCKPVQSGNIHGLASLSLVVGQLSDGKSRYISYRDSPTTELLQDALGGRAKCAWLTHLIPGSDNMDYDENVATLHMAKRTAKIRNRPQRIQTEPLGLAPEIPEKEPAVKAAEERKELEELKSLLTSGPSSKRSVPSQRLERAAAATPGRAERVSSERPVLGAIAGSRARSLTPERAAMPLGGGLAVDAN